MTQVVKIIAREEKIRAKIFWFLFIFFLVALLTYIYFFISIFINASISEGARKSLANLRVEYQEVEGRYLEVVSHLDIETAYALGFIDEGESDVVTTDTALLVRR